VKLLADDVKLNVKITNGVDLCVREQGPRTCTLPAPLQSAFIAEKANKFHCCGLELATIANMLQTISIQCRVVIMTANVNNRCQVICLKQSKASLHVKKKKYSSSIQRRLKQVITHASKHYRLFPCLSHSVNNYYATTKHFQALPMHVYSTSITVCETG